MKQRILFLCTGNSARSQMAEALLGLIAVDHFEADSAGTHPAGLHPMTVETMRGIGVDVRHYRSKHLEEFVGSPSTTLSRCAIEPRSPVRSLLAWSIFDIGLLMIPPQPHWRPGSRSSGGCGMKLQIGCASF
jgi:hypothetical protein